MSILNLHVFWTHHCVYPENCLLQVEKQRQNQFSIALSFSGRSTRSECFSEILEESKHQVTLVSTPVPVKGLNSSS